MVALWGIAPVSFGSKVVKQMKRYALQQKAHCVYGGEPLNARNITDEHVIPKERISSGLNPVFNRAVACRNCNETRQHQSLQKWNKEGLYDNIVRYVAEMQDFTNNGFRYGDTITGVLSDALHVSEKALERDIQKHTNGLSIAA